MWDPLAGGETSFPGAVRLFLELLGMDQHVTEEEVAAFVFDDPARDPRIDAHLCQCRRCSRVAHALRALASEYRDSQAAPEPTGVNWDAIFQRILAGLARRQRPIR